MPSSSPPSPPVSKSAIGRNPTVSASEPLLSSDRLAESIALALKSLLSPASPVKPSGRPTSSASRADLPCVSLRSGLGLRAGRRSQEEVAAGRILVSRFDRGDSPDSRKKLHDRVCVQLPHILTSPDYSSLLSSDSASDLGSSAIDTQTAINGVVDWAVTHDVFYVCNIPVDVDLTDVSALGSSEVFVNLLTGYKTVSFDKVALYQELVNTYGVEVDVESSTWLLQVLSKSVESSLLVQVKQTYDTLSDVQRGGLTFFKLLVDRIDHRSFESTQALLNFITGFQLANFDGENVPLATARFKAVVRLLPTAAIPPNLLEYFLNGMAVCASDDFKEACKSQLGFISNPIYTDWAIGRDLLSQLLPLQLK